MPRHRTLLTALVLLTIVAPATSQPSDSLLAKNGMVVSSSPLASQAGAAIMRQGGNAFDAAAATGFALAVTYPQAGNLGGGGFMVAHTASSNNISLDFRETAPSSADRDMYLDDNGDVVPGLSLRSALASGVPGSVDGLLRLWEDHGSGAISREVLLAEAIRLAAEGFPLNASLAKSLNGRAESFKKNAPSFTRTDGEPWTEGDLLIQPDLAETLRRIAEHGKDGFYTGKVATLIADQQAQAGARITREDLAEYQAVYRDPVEGSFNDYRIVSMGAPSSGGILLVQMLNMLEARPLEDFPRGSTEYVHLLTEVQRRAYADRAQHLGDPDYWNVPTRTLTSKPYATARAYSIDPHAATPSSDVHAGAAAQPESPETTHYSVVDAKGNAVAVTVTLNGSFGSGIVVDGAGFFMNNEMDDFSIKPGVPNLYGLIGGEANAIEPGKRMLSSMTPTVILKDDKPAIVLGSPGGSTIITTVLQVFLNVATHGMSIQDAVAAPRHHSQWLPDAIRYEEGAISREAEDALIVLGHPSLRKTSFIGAANCIAIDASGIHGAPDPRRGGSAAGY